VERDGWAADGQRLAADPPFQQIAQSVYEIPLKKGILYQPHPAFPKDEAGQYRYYPITPEQLKNKYAITDFQETGTRELTAHDYVYGLRRLASPRVVSPSYAFLAEHIVGMQAYGEALREKSKQLDQNQWLGLRRIRFDGA